MEKRTLFASDLSPFVDDFDACFAYPAQVLQPMPSNDRTTEIANSPLSLSRGDVIRFEVPEEVLLQLTDRDSYQLQVFYSENYFSYDTISLNSMDQRAIPNQVGAYGFSRDSAGASWSKFEEQLQNDLQQDETSIHAFRTAKSSNSSNADLGAILLASLTASNDFEGHVRVLDSDQDLNGTVLNSAIAGLPNEVRIEPLITMPTVMRDPGATLVKTIVVNRAPSGLLVSTASGRLESMASDGTLGEEGSNSQASEKSEASKSSPLLADSEKEKPSRPFVTLKTIDISAVRRNEPARSWMRSSSIANPALHHEAEDQEPSLNRPTSELRIVASTNAPKADADLAKPTRREQRVPGTRMQPVEFLLSDSMSDENTMTALESASFQTTDQAISQYVESSRTDSEGTDVLSQKWNELAALSSLFPTSSPIAIDLLFADENGHTAWNRQEETALERLEYLVFTPIQGGVASNRESWKNALRSASDSTAGQVLFAGLASLAVQHRDINAFGTKTAWEYVTKPAQNVPV